MLSRSFRSRSRTFPMTLYPQNRETIFHLITSIVLSWGGFLGMDDNLVMGVFCVVLFGLCTLVFIHQLCSKSDYLRIDYDGFMVCSLHQKRYIPWSAVESFFPYRASSHKLVNWRYRPEFLARSGVSVNRLYLQIDDALPNTYGMKPETLAALMNELRLCHQLAHYYDASR